MPVDVRCEIVIHRPRGAVAEYLLDPTRLAQWRAGVAAVRPVVIGDGGPSVGREYRVQTPGRLRAGEHVERVVERVPLERLVLAGPDLRTTLTLAPEHRNSTLVGLHLTGGNGPMARLTAPLAERGLRRDAVADLERLKTILELARPA